MCWRPFFLNRLEELGSACHFRKYCSGGVCNAWCGWRGCGCGCGCGCVTQLLLRLFPFLNYLPLPVLVRAKEAQKVLPIYTHMRMHAHMHTHTHTCTHAHTHARTRARSRARTDTHQRTKCSPGTTALFFKSQSLEWSFFFFGKHLGLSGVAFQWRLCICIPTPHIHTYQCIFISFIIW